MRKIFFYVLLGILLVLLSLPQFWQYIYDFFPEPQAQTAQINFTSLFGKYSLLIDGKKVGEINDKETKLFTKISAGEKTIKILRISDVPNFYFTLEKRINLMQDAQVDIEWEAGPTLESSNGIFRYFTETNNEEGTELQIIALPMDSKIEVNSVRADSNKTTIKTTDSIKVKVSNGEEYEEKDFEVKYNSIKKNIRNTIEVYLYKRPFSNY